MFIRALAAAAVILVSAIPALAGITGESCVSREAATRILADQGQEIVGAGDGGGAVVSVAMNPETGDWTLMFTNKDTPSVVCLGALGKDWIVIEPPLPGNDT